MGAINAQHGLLRHLAALGLLVTALAAGLGLALAAAAPARAAEQPGISLFLRHQWESFGEPWVPYQVTVVNDGASAFTGEVVLLPEPLKPAAGTPVQRVTGQSLALGGLIFRPATLVGPTYRVPVTVPGGKGQRAVTIFVQEAESGYRAELRSSSGEVTARAEVDDRGLIAGKRSIGMLTDVQAGALLLANLPGIGAGATRFRTVDEFPNSAVDLTGLSEVVIDDFDTSTLSGDQLRALRDFVDLGGGLVLGGGQAGQRTLGPLPPELLPLRPTGAATASMAPLAELGGLTTPISAPVVTGEPAPGSRTMLEGADHVPLVVQSDYGAGRIVELTYDPFAEPLASDYGLRSAAWQQGVARAMSTPPDAIPAPHPQATPRPVPTGDALVWSSLCDRPAGAAASQVQPVVVLLLAFYALAAAPLSYLLVSRLRRRELIWAALPLGAVVFVAATFAVASASRGGAFVDNQVRIERRSPGGTTEVDAYHALVAPRRGDFLVRPPAGSIISTAVLPPEECALADSNDVVAIGAHPLVTMGAVAIWNLRTLHTLSITHRGPFLEAHLSLAARHIVGRITNHGKVAARDVWVRTHDNRQARLAVAVAPGATVEVDAALVAEPYEAASPLDRLARIAAATTSGRPDQLALTATFDSNPDLVIDGAGVDSTPTALLAEPVALESADAGLGVLPVFTPLGSNSDSLSGAYEMALPPGSRGSFRLTYTDPPLPAQFAGKVPAARVEVYNWDAGTWRALPPTPAAPAPQGSGASSPPPAATITLERGEVSDGVVRARVLNLVPFSYAGAGGGPGNPAQFQVIVAG